MTKYNPGYLTSKGAENDNGLTPAYAVIPLLKYIRAKKYKKILCPFDTPDSNYVKIMRENGLTVRSRHISEGKDFFDIYRTDCDLIVSNPPFSLKDSILKRLYFLNKPFAMLLPIPALQSTKRVPLFIKYGLQLLVFDRRICFYNPEDPGKLLKGVAFATGYFCKDLLPRDLVFETIKEEL